ncbi:Site-specific DNA recombinase [Bradyrhizobium erythrophlei]|nr:Site-specific DNA recombinase [Bradyrhizobium erythrophlei]
MKTAAIYARVSSDKQREENTIASQTAALVAFARAEQFEVPKEWVFEDDGYSGANLIRPGLERVRDLAAEGLIQAVLIYAPDRLSRRYAHQILLIEELARAGVETLFVRAPRGSTPEDELLVQFQGMIAEYERAQILERSRRGKRHRARQGEVSVLSGAPFGFRFIRKTDHSAAYYQIDEEQARIVRWMFELYTVQGLSIGAIARLLNEQAIPTCKRRGRWERSTVWGMLRNPAYKGQACFGKTTLAPRQRITRPIRMRGGISSITNSTDGSQRREKPTRPNAVRRLSAAISFASARASIACSPPIRTAFSRWTNCASACRTCGGANKPTTPNCRRSSTSQSTAQPTCASLKRWPRSLRDCGRRRGPSTYWNASASCGFSSRKSSSATTRSSSGTAFLCPWHRATARQPAVRTLHCRLRKVTFCVRGAITDPRPVPLSLTVTIPSSRTPAGPQDCAQGAARNPDMSAHPLQLQHFP